MSSDPHQTEAIYHGRTGFFILDAHKTRRLTRVLIGVSLALRIPVYTYEITSDGKLIHSVVERTRS